MFLCDHCHTQVKDTPEMGVINRNHCPRCLWSKHVDEIPGDRKALCDGLMAPIGLTIKKSQGNKYKPEKNSGEIEIVHQCTKCGKVNINRIAGDDDTNTILDIFAQSVDGQKGESGEIQMLQKNDKEHVLTLLFGKK